MTHVAFVIPSLDRMGGAERQVLHLAHGLARRGWRVSVIALSGDGESTAGQLRNAGIAFTTLRMRKGLADPRGWMQMRNWIRRHRPDVIHAHLPHAAFMARWSRLLAPSRVIVDTIHTAATGGAGRRLGYRISRWLPDRVTIVGQGAAEAWTARRLVRADNAQVLQNGIDTRICKPDAAARQALRARLGIADDFVWLAAGRLEAVKGYRVLLDAMALLPSSARLFIAGSGSLEAELRSQASRLELDERVRSLGFVADLRPWMQAADGAVLASDWEGLPMVLLEAAACALPAVATNVPGSREAIVSGETGFLCSRGDPMRLAEAMQRVMRMRPSERCAMGASARQRAIAEFDLECVLDRWEKLYGELLSRRPAPARWAQ